MGPLSRRERRILLPLALLCALLAMACSPLRNVPEGEALLTKLTIKTKDKPSDISKGELERYLRQKPNSRILGLRFHLWLYNMGKPGVETGIHGWFHRIGEPPAVYSDALTQQSVKNLTTYLRSRGFYECRIRDSVYDKGTRRKGVTYTVEFGQPTHIDSVQVTLDDTLARAYVMQGWPAWGLKKGMRLDEDNLAAVRSKISRALRDQGYFNFKGDYIDYLADTIGHARSAQITVKIPDWDLPNRPHTMFRRYYIDSINLYTAYEPMKPATGVRDSLKRYERQGISLYFPGRKPGLRYGTMDQLLVARPDSIARYNLLAKTQQNLLGVGVYQLASLRCQTADTPRDTIVGGGRQPLYPLSYDLRLTPFDRQSYQIELMLTTSGSIGMEGSLTYRHRNLFRGAEQFEWQFNAQIEAIRKREGLNFKYALELGTRMSLTYPGFLFPLLRNSFRRRFTPKTKFRISYNYQRRPDYTRTIATGAMSYSWESGPKATHTLTPIEVNVLKIFSIQSDFEKRMRKSYMANSYISQLIHLGSYTFNYATQQTELRRNTHGFRASIEVAGNQLWLAKGLIAKRNDQGVYELFGLPFAQYARTDVSYSFHWVLDKNNTFAMRLYYGVGYPYGNSVSLPFEKKFYGGGASGVRAWHARDLGPGSYAEHRLQFPNQTADMRIEGNLEYRFWMFWKIYGALFIDAGNIWSITEADDREGAQFHFSEFYRQIAVGYGLGFRLNLGFFVLRTDLGVKFHDPAARPDFPYGYWIPMQRGFMARDVVFHFAVGYPF